MEIRELFDMIQNPIDDSKVVEKLITAYANESKGLGGFYGQLTKTVSKEYTGGQFNQEDANKFYAMLFNKWKNSIVNMTRDEFAELYKKGSYGKDFIKMRNYLKNVPDVSTMKEANNIFFGNKNDSELQTALEKYRWSAVGEATGWVHVYSRDLTAKKDPRIVAEHRLYLDTESPDTYKMVTYFVEKCDKYHLPYYFKFDQMADRDDTIVIYSSSETLTDYVNILQEIKKEHPELISRVKEPPLLTGKIDGWIGYGSEPQKTPDGKRRSFNEIRSKVIEPIIEKHTKNWIMAHLNMQVTYKGQQLSFQNYIALKSTEFLIEKLETKYSNREETMKNFAKKNGSSYNPQAVVENLGYTLQDLKNPQFQKSVYNIMVANLKTSLPKVCNGNYNDMSTLLINVRNGKQISFPGSYLEEILQSLSINITKNDPTFLPTIQNQIRNSAPKYGIDPNNFCFDIAAKNKLENIASKNKVDEQFLEKNGISKPVAEFLIKNGIDLNNLTATFNSIINGTTTARQNDYEYTLTWGNMIYKNNSQQEVYIRDIIGSFGLEENADFLTCVSKFYNEKDEYGKRSLNNLKKDILSNVEDIINSDVPLKLIEMDGKYYVGQDGNHRTFYLMLAYMVLKEKYKNDPNMLQQIEDKFRIKAEVTKKSGYETIDKICYCLSKCWNDDIKLFFDNGNESIATLQIGDIKYDIKEETNFIDYFNTYLDALDKTSKKYIDLNNQLSNMGYPNQIINEIEENPSMSENTDVNNLDVQTITEILNPTLMERKMKLPNGIEIPAKQYIQEIVYPHLPENGLVILSNGSILPVKQFIEECVMFECQEKYNGDFPRYMAEKTKNNLGVVSLEYGNETYEINPVEITEYIGPELLEKRIKLPNGVDISARQYIQEVFAPYIPSNGRITLSNGIDISVKQYIEEILLCEAQEKYDGDITQILYNTTRNNDGTINIDPIKMEKSLIDMRKQTELLENKDPAGPRR